jgi:deoxyribonuclease-4
MSALLPPLGPPLGAHVSVAGGLPTAFPRAADLGCGAMQIFAKNANQWQGRELTSEEAAEFRGAHAASAVGPVISHASYLINLATADPALLARSQEALADELDRAARLGLVGVVLHPGAHVGAGEEAGVARVAVALDGVLSRLPARSGDVPRVLLENTAGQGSCLGHRLEQLAAIRAAVSEPGRIGFCLDTCHAFAAGYAIHEEAGWDDFLGEVESRLGWEALGALHLNDSVRPFGSRRDRHAAIGEGEIGLAAFGRLLREPRLAHLPMVVETETGEEMAGHRRDLATLRGLLAEPAPRSKRRRTKR